MGDLDVELVNRFAEFRYGTPANLHTCFLTAPHCNISCPQNLVFTIRRIIFFLFGFAAGLGKVSAKLKYGEKNPPNYTLWPSRTVNTSKYCQQDALTKTPCICNINK
jgi:hypothetical protein